jgi:hypothetical protein
MFAVAIAAGDADRPALGVRDDHGMHAIELAGAADVLDRVPRAVTALRHRPMIAADADYRRFIA